MSLKFKVRWDGPLKIAYIFPINKLKKRLKAHIQQQFKSTGKLFSSFTFKAKAKGIDVSSNAPYAAAQEFGADIPARYPKKAAALRWEQAGKVVFSKYAKAFRLRERPYMRPALEEFFDKDVEVAPKD